MSDVSRPLLIDLPGGGVTSAGSLRRETAFRDERFSALDDIRVVDRQDLDRRPTDGRQPDEHRPLPGEVFAPAVSSRVVEPGQLAGHRVAAGDVRAFVKVAMDAGQREVRGLVTALVLVRDDVIDLVAGIRGRLRELVG